MKNRTRLLAYLSAFFVLCWVAPTLAQQAGFLSSSGTFSPTWGVGGTTGPILNNNAGVLEGKNAANSTFVVVRGATPVAANDLTTKAYVDGQIAGDVTVVNGVTMPAGGALTTGTVLTATGVGTAAYLPLNLSLGAATTGTLPFGRGGTGLSSLGSADQLLGVNHAGSALAYFTAGGDASLASGLFTVGGLKGQALPSLATGFLQWNGSAWAFSTPASVGVTGSGFWHSTAGALDPGASRGTAAQIPITNAGATDAPWVSIAGDATLAASGSVTVGGLKGQAVPSLSTGFLQWNGSSFAWTTPASAGVTGSGVWHSASGSLSPAASIGTAGQVLDTNAGATDTQWVSVSGDATFGAAGALTLATVNGNVGTFGSSSTVPIVTVNAKGLATAVTTATVAAPLASATGTLGTANGGTGLSSLGSADQLLGVNHAGSALNFFTLAGDGTLASGALTNTGLRGQAVPSLSAGFLQWTGSTFAWTTPPTTGGAVTGTGYWHSTGGALDAGASHGSVAGQIPVTNAGVTDAPFVTLSGDAVLSGAGALTLATVNGAPGTFGAGASVPVVTVNGKGLVTLVTTTPVTASLASATGVLPVANGGTGLSAAGSNGQVLTTVGGSPAWANISAPGTTLVFQPGGTAVGNVFTTWSSLFTAAGNVVGPLTVYFDGSLNGSAATIPSGAWNFTNSYVRFQGPTSPFSAITTVTAATGATISGVNEYTNLFVVNASTSPVTTFSGSAIAVVRFFSSTVDASSSAPFFSVSGTGIFVLQAFYSGNIGFNQPNPVITCGSTANCSVELFQLSALASTALTGSGHYTIQIDDTAVTNQVVSPAPQFATKALNLGYNDALVSPALGVVQTQAAIDALKPRLFTAGGDLSGTPTSQTVGGIRGSAVPSLASGWLQWNGSAFVWSTPPGSVSTPTGSGVWHNTAGALDGAASHGTAGQLLFTNAGATDTQWGSFSGDVSLSTTPGVTTVAKIDGASVPAAGSLTTGNGLYVTGPSTLSYSALNLAGGPNFVTGVLPSASQAPQTLAGDVTGAANANVVTRLSGSGGSVVVPSGVSIVTPGSSSVAIDFSNASTGLISAGPSGVIAPLYEFPAGTNFPSILINPQTSNTATSTLEVFGQPAFASATGANRNGGPIVLLAGPPASGGVPGAVSFVAGDTNAVIKLSEPAIGGTVSLSFGSGAISPTITQDAPGANVAGKTMTLAAQSGGSGNANGGSLTLASGAGTGANIAGAVICETGDTNTQVDLSPVNAVGAFVVTGGATSASVRTGIGSIPGGTNNTQAALERKFWQGGQVVANGGQIDLLVPVGTGTMVTVHATAQCRITTPGTFTAVGDSVITEGTLTWKNVGGSVSSVGTTVLQNSYISFDATMNSGGTPMHMSPSGANVDVTMLIGAFTGSLGVADCTIWAEARYN
jgi:hypothetical protein